MKTSDFRYDLPEELIAHRPLESRDQSRLLHIQRSAGTIAHQTFSDLPSFLRPGDRLVFNNTRVIPSRLFVLKEETGLRIELLFVEACDSLRWKVIAKPARRLKVGGNVFLEKDPAICFTIEEHCEDGGRILSCVLPIIDIMEKYGEMPIPPYISRRADACDRETYQTVYAKEQGAIAAPTAGLHFTESLLDTLRAQNIDMSFVTLHVGIGTFRPVKVEDPQEHPMHTERYTLSAQTVKEIEETRKQGGRIIAVGTTVVRTLESASVSGELCPQTADTRLLILPGYRFRFVDALLTNFHLSESTLLMLVSAFYSRDKILAAYTTAIEERYRFFSYGDAMFIE